MTQLVCGNSHFCGKSLFFYANMAGVSTPSGEPAGRNVLAFQYFSFDSPDFKQVLLAAYVGLSAGTY